MTEQPIRDPLAHDASGAIVAAISREVVHIYAEYFGRGPTRAKTFWREEVITCVLEDVFTRAEHLLVKGGRFDQVRLNRQAFQEQIEPQMRAKVEELTGRRVSICLSQINEVGVGAEIFVLGEHPLDREA